jgi:hypothetical protein
MQPSGSVGTVSHKLAWWRRGGGGAMSVTSSARSVYTVIYGDQPQSGSKWLRSAAITPDQSVSVPYLNAAAFNVPGSVLPLSKPAVCGSAGSNQPGQRLTQIDSHWM